MSGSAEPVLLWPRAVPPRIFEIEYSYAFCPEATARLTGLEPRFYPEGADLGWLRRELRGARWILLAAHPEIVVSGHGVSSMLEAGEAFPDALVLPALSATRAPDQLAGLPFPYQDRETFEEVSELVRKEGPPPRPVEGPVDTALSLFSVEAAGPLPDSIPLRNLGGAWKGRVVVAGRALAHQFLETFGAGREDLAALAPQDAREVLDIGCAEGGYGRTLKADRPGIRIVGVEPNPVLARRAREHYDLVVEAPVEQADLEGPFDLANMGDVLEHLVDPWSVLKRIRDLLRPGGALTGSVPNFGHWTVVRELARGRLEYVPVGLLCVGHVRWFTLESLERLLRKAGFELEELRREAPRPTPSGRRFIEALSSSGLGDKDSLETAEYLFRARRR